MSSFQASLHLVPHTRAIDGIQRAALDLSRGLAAAGEPPRVLVLGGGDNLAAWKKVAAVELIAPFLRCSPGQPVAMAQAALAAWRLGKGSSVVVAHRLDLVNAGAMFAARGRCPLILHAHNAPPNWLRWGDRRQVPGTRRVNGLIVASEFMCRSWEKVVGDVPIRVIPYPIDVEHFAAPSPERRAAARVSVGAVDGQFVATFVGRLEEAKGAHILLDATRMMHERGCSIRVVMQGSPSLGASAAAAQAYREQCEIAAGPCPVTWVSPGPDVRDAIHASDVCVVPSVWPEPSGLTVAEALATGTPLVASAVGGIPEQIPTGSAQARLVPPGDPSALVAALDALRERVPTNAERRALREHIKSSRDLATLTERYRSAIHQ